jgi:sec-independent protein translocase protein TatA
MGAFQPIHLIILLVIVVLLFGGSKIPELMRGVGKGMGEFKKGIEEGKRIDEDAQVKKDETAVKS